MAVNAVEFLDTVQRSVQPVAEGTRSLTLSLTVAAPIADVWDALTSAERISRWFLPITGELRTGGRYQLEGNAGGEVLSCDPPQSFDVTWEFGGENSRVGVNLSQSADGGTALALEHAAAVDPERWDEYGPAAVGIGWDMVLLGLTWHVENGIDTPVDNPQWVFTDEAKAAMAGSSGLWAQAAIAAGADAALAHAAADRTTTFYTG
ncbi:uncharacterized protein YndB with AHSA1/START domain [Rhodococcus sp. 27YEA15]|uniref:SRPBCC family protein n=1 Tax=Rhodococcus sp. 27YEA15 TaxID=3156259 RepID=UPI003C7E857C